MSITNGPNLGLMENGNAGEVHYSQFMAFLRGIDGLVMPNVKGYLTNTPPGSPTSGDCYIIGAAPTGAWAGQGGKVARWSTTASSWEFYAPKNGWMLQANSARETYRYTGGTWEVFYQEGTWTPVLTAATTAPTGVTYTNQAARFTKIGNHISCQFGFKLSNAGAGGVGSVQVAGLPFTPPTYGPYVNPTFRAGVVNNLVTAANAPILSFYIMDNMARIESRLQTNSDVAMQWTEITNTTSILGEFFYQF